MQVSSLGSVATVSRRFTIAEGDQPVVNMAYSNPLKKVVVDRGSIQYTYRDGRWTVEDEWSVTVVGQVLRKDGTPGANNHKRSPEAVRAAAARDGQRELVLAEGWEWLQVIIDLLRPTGVLTTPDLNEAEVDW